MSIIVNNLSLVPKKKVKRTFGINNYNNCVFAINNVRVFLFKDYASMIWNLKQTK